MSLYWKWEKAIPKSVCEALIEEMKDVVLEHSSLNKGFVDEEKRNSKQCFLKINHWYLTLMMKKIQSQLL